MGHTKGAGPDTWACDVSGCTETAANKFPLDWEKVNRREAIDVEMDGETIVDWQLRPKFRCDGHRINDWD